MSATALTTSDATDATVAPDATDATVAPAAPATVTDLDKGSWNICQACKLVETDPNLRNGYGWWSTDPPKCWNCLL